MADNYLLISTCLLIALCFINSCHCFAGRNFLILDDRSLLPIVLQDMMHSHSHHPKEVIVVPYAKVTLMKDNKHNGEYGDQSRLAQHSPYNSPYNSPAMPYRTRLTKSRYDNKPRKTRLVYRTHSDDYREDDRNHNYQHIDDEPHADDYHHNDEDVMQDDYPQRSANKNRNDYEHIHSYKEEEEDMYWRYNGMPHNPQ